MSKVSKSIYYFGIYMIIVGTSLVFIPNLLLQLANLPTTDQVWIRLGGLLSAILGGYYIQAAKNNLTLFYRATVYGRFIFAFGVLTFVLFNFVKPILLIISVVDVLGALLTAKLLKDENNTIKLKA